MVLPDCVESLVCRFGRDDVVLTHLQELDQRLSDGAVVFDNKDDEWRFSYHVEIIGISGAKT